MNAAQRALFDATGGADRPSLKAPLAALQQIATVGSGAPNKLVRRQPKRETLPAPLKPRAVRLFCWRIRLQGRRCPAQPDLLCRRPLCSGAQAGCGVPVAKAFVTYRIALRDVENFYTCFNELKSVIRNQLILLDITNWH